MKNLISIFVLLTFFACSNEGEVVDTDFARSNWGDSYTIVEKTYRNEKEFKLSNDMITYEIQSFKDTAEVMFLFLDDKLISGQVKYHEKNAKDTKKLYDAYVKKNRDKFGLETYTGEKQYYDSKVIEQKIWKNEHTLVSIVFDNYKLNINFYDKHKMPKN